MCPGTRSTLARLLFSLNGHLVHVRTPLPELRTLRIRACMVASSHALREISVDPVDLGEDVAQYPPAALRVGFRPVVRGARVGEGRRMQGVGLRLLDAAHEERLHVCRAPGN